MRRLEESRPMRFVTGLESEAFFEKLGVARNGLVRYPARSVIRLTHDDLITIYARSQPTRLLTELKRLGLEPKRRGLRRGRGMAC